jgi:hypothetical protein
VIFFPFSFHLYRLPLFLKIKFLSYLKKLFIAFKIIYKYIIELVGFPPVQLVAPWLDKLEASASSAAAAVAAAASASTSSPSPSPIVAATSSAAS